MSGSAGGSVADVLREEDLDALGLQVGARRIDRFVRERGGFVIATRERADESFRADEEAEHGAGERARERE